MYAYYLAAQAPARRITAKIYNATRYFGVPGNWYSTSGSLLEVQIGSRAPTSSATMSTEEKLVKEEPPRGKKRKIETTGEGSDLAPPKPKRQKVLSEAKLKYEKEIKKKAKKYSRGSAIKLNVRDTFGFVVPVTHNPSSCSSTLCFHLSHVIS